MHGRPGPGPLLQSCHPPLHAARSPSLQLISSSALRVGRLPQMMAHTSSLLAAVAAPLSGRSGCASGHMCRRVSVTSSGGRRGAARLQIAATGQAELSLARPGSRPARVTGRLIH